MKPPSSPQQIPAIAPVPEGTKRPRWSVMVPTFNCATFLAQTIKSVLDQGFSEDEMEIIVVDDVSTNDNPLAVVLEVGGGRVKFVKNEKNLGATANFNRCIELSTGKLVHILHGDDWVAPGFYEEIARLEETAPDCAFYATRTVAVEEDGSWKWISPRNKALEKASNDASACSNEQFFQTPSVVVRREFYEQCGGFCQSLHHVADWEMWVRAIHEGNGIISSKALAYYRTFEGNDSGRLAKTGANVIDNLKLISVFDRVANFDPVRFRKRCAEQAWRQANRFLGERNFDASWKNARVYLRIIGIFGLVRFRHVRFLMSFFVKRLSCASP